MLLPAPFCYLDNVTPLPCLRAIFPRLFWDVANRIHDVTSLDHSTVSQCKLKDTSSGRIRLPTLQIWGLSLGMEASHIEHLQRSLPCQGDITCWPLGNCIIEECGVWAYCNNCSTIVAALGESWHLDVTSHYMSHCVLRFLEVYSGPTCTQDVFLYVNPHLCSSSCPRARRSL